MLGLSCFFLSYHLVLLIWLIYGARKLSHIKNEAEGMHSVPDLPSLSIVVPARNEKQTLKVGLDSLTQLTYPHLEILVVNDRSTDGTAQVLANFQSKEERLRVLSVAKLPKGWLGKNHALHLGAAASQSELILFTDADVEIKDSFLKRAVQFLNANHLDHLAAIPQVTAGKWSLYPVLGVFGLAFSLFTRPWLGKNPKKDQAVGIGAFNLVRRSAYQAIDGHSKLSLRPDDDLKLALVLKRNGFRTDCVKAVEGIRVEWYASFKQLMHGLEKNVMTGFEYSFPKAILGNVLFAVTFLMPFILVGFSSGLNSFVSWATLFVLLAAYGGQLFEARMPLWCIPFFPLAALGILIVFARACWLTYRNQGVFWRDTFYSLDELRSNRFD